MSTKGKVTTSTVKFFFSSTVAFGHLSSDDAADDVVDHLTAVVLPARGGQAGALGRLVHERL